MNFSRPKVLILAPIAVALALALAAIGSAPVVRAQSPAPPSDLACRNCHSGSSQEFVFPSGETVAVGVDVTTLDEAPHSGFGVHPVPCTSCHTGQGGRYRYPHEANPAETQRDFATEVSGNCEACHYAHKPFHPIEGTDVSELEGELPVCADCHGSHDIARVEAMPEEMPPRCLACHESEGAAWVSEFLQPRPGMGVGAEGYAGSTRCSGCHDDVYFRWQDTLHARLIQNVTDDPEAIVGDFSLEDGGPGFGVEDIAYTIGGRWRQAYLTQAPTVASTDTMTSALALLPMQWLVASEAWAPLEEGGSLRENWITECGSCHVTGLDTESWGFTEFGIGCEGCHGPAADHAVDPENVTPYAVSDDQVCGSCHSRGLSEDGFHFPASYRPGEPLEEHFTFTESDEDLWPDGSAKRNHQQYVDWQLGSSMALSDQVRCVTCHAVHGVGQAAGQLRAPLNDVCVACHGEQEALAQHTPFHQQALRERDFTCADCHMPLMATTAQPFDLHNHSFLQPDPEGTITHGGVEAMPNSCNLCHTSGAESPEWAMETIAHAKSLAPEISFFGPGPTPTSPPPPTPMPSVGQVTKLEVTPPFWWLRWAAILLAVVVAALVVVWILLSVRSRRNADG